MGSMKGILLAGGQGTRLLPATKVVNKHLIPLLNIPMITYPLETLKKFGVEDILIVSGGEHIGGFAEYLSDGSEFGVNLTYKIQKEAGGIAQALGLAKDFVGNEPLMVILGDNIFDNEVLSIHEDKTRAQIFVKKVPDPERFGVLSEGIIVEKPKDGKSEWAVTGLYIYPPDVFDIIQTLKPSKRGELEITDVNNAYLEKGEMLVNYLEGCFWSDAGTPHSLWRTVGWLGQRQEYQL